MIDNRFQVFKKALDGSESKWGYVQRLTLDQTRNEMNFPFGRHVDKDGTPYVWCYSLMGA